MHLFQSCFDLPEKYSCWVIVVMPIWYLSLFSVILASLVVVELALLGF